MNQSIYIRLDEHAQEWIRNAWGTEITKKNLLGIIIGPHVHYAPKTGIPGFKDIIRDPGHLRLEILSKLNGKDLRSGVYVPGKYHKAIELAIKDVMRTDFLNYMELARKISDSMIKNLIYNYIDYYHLPNDRLDFEYFKKLYYESREKEISPKNPSFIAPISFCG